MKEKNYSIQLAKLVCAFLVISIHTHPFLKLNKFIYFEISHVISRVAVPLFFVISGYFYHLKINNNPNYLKKYSKNIASLYLAWSILYFPYDFIYQRVIQSDKSILVDIISYIRVGIFRGTHFHLWYLPSSIVAMFLLNFIHKKKLSNSNIIKIFIIIFYLFGLFGMSYYKISLFLHLDKIYTIYHKIFVSLRNGIIFGLPFMYLGYQIKNISIDKYPYKKIIFCMLASFIIFNLEAFLDYFFNLAEDYDLTFSIVFLVYFIMIFLLKDPFKNFKKIKDYSFEIYAIHGGVIIFVGHFIKENYTLLFFSVAILSFLIAYLLKNFPNFITKKLSH